MKVCVIASIFAPYSRGGAEVVAQTTAKIFQENGDEVFVITISPWQGFSSFFQKIEFINGLKIYRFYPLNFFSFLNINRYPAFLRLFWHFLDMFNLHSYWVVKKILRQEKPDLILTHNLKGIGYSIPRAILSLKKEYFFHWFHTLHDIGAIHPTGLCFWGKENSFFQKNFLVKLYYLFNRWLFSSPEIVISSSNFLLEEYRQRGFFKNSKLVVLRNPVLISSLPSQTNKRDVFRFFYLGQLEPYKGLFVLYEAWKRFYNDPANKDKKLELLIAGQGSLEKEIKNWPRQGFGVRFLGFLSHQKLQEIFQSVFFTVVPSLVYENASMAVIESFACGVPVVASRIGGISEMVKEGDNGLLFEPGNVEDLILAFKTTLKIDWLKFSQEAYKSFFEHSPKFYLQTIKDLISLSS